eukprot:309725_1
MADEVRHESKLDSVKYQCKELFKPTNVRGFIVWSVWNIIRYLVVGYLIFTANNNNAKDLDDHKQYCCACYQHSKNQSLTFDLSYCIPTCSNCTFCEDHPEYATENFTCPVPGYHNRYPDTSPFNSDWKHATGCTGAHQENVSIISMFFFLKSYSVYAKFALSISIIYAIFNLFFAVLAFYITDMCEIFFRWLWMYNIFVTEACLYLMFKPFQYEKKTYSISGQNVICRRDVISKDWENILASSIIYTLTLVTIHWTWICGWIIWYICKYIKSCHKHNRGRNVSVSLVANKQMQHGNATHYIKLASNKRKSKRFAYVFISILVFFVMLVFVVLLIVIAAKTVRHQHRYQLLPTWMYYMVYIFLGFSLIDNPWIVSKICQFSAKFSKMFD